VGHSTTASVLTRISSLMELTELAALDHAIIGATVEQWHHHLTVCAKAIQA